MITPAVVGLRSTTALPRWCYRLTNDDNGIELFETIPDQINRPPAIQMVFFGCILAEFDWTTAFEATRNARLPSMRLPRSVF
jgi:hypothetical protein